MRNHNRTELFPRDNCFKFSCDVRLPTIQFATLSISFVCDSTIFRNKNKLQVAVTDEHIRFKNRIHCEEILMQRREYGAAHDNVFSEVSQP